MLTSFAQNFLQITVIVDNFSNFFQNFSLKEVNRRPLLSFVTFPKFSERYFVYSKSYLA